MTKYSRMTKENLRQLCKDMHFHDEPSLNDTLYLHYKGFTKIENLEEYTGLKNLWLHSNKITRIENLENQKQLKTLFLQENIIGRIENLHQLKHLEYINLSYNFIRKIENLSCLPNLKRLDISQNLLSTAQDIRHLSECQNLTIVDLSRNRLDGIELVDVLANTNNIIELNMLGNTITRSLANYRMVLISTIKSLRELDYTLVTDKERACAAAWARGGIDAEKKERIRWDEMERKHFEESINIINGYKREKNGKDHERDSNIEYTEIESQELESADDKNIITYHQLGRIHYERSKYFSGQQTPRLVKRTGRLGNNYNLWELGRRNEFNMNNWRKIVKKTPEIDKKYENYISSSIESILKEEPLTLYEKLLFWYERMDTEEVIK
ncbi:dynein assembly factor 1, axonemal-like isoform X1 [Centruroides sculpturatus]|uniref:dynein assembly factor 1, axonemal-like isoform X1 n=1 Tax=Centruroides sculpturatus TaxID=218467 RepID=UPI000C6CB394|nr:dynein assembly factor 1, axonemal-like isoform X1 [Centruroides sculpturatus]